jgi:hypothetical protein
MYLSQGSHKLLALKNHYPKHPMHSFGVTSQSH